MQEKNKIVLFVIVILIIMIIIVCTCWNRDTKSTIIEGTTESTTEDIESVAEDIESVAEDVTDKKENTIETETDKEVDTNQAIQPVSLGKFRLTAYCNCTACCGQWAGGATASGVMPVANHTIAVDTRIIPFGTSVIINGNTYVAEDTGSAIKGNRIDIYFDTHQEALNFGVQYAEVYRATK